MPEDARPDPSPPDSDDRDWTDAPLEDLVDHVVTRFHRPLEAELPRLETLAEAVRKAHGAKDPGRFDDLVDTVAALHGELVDHMAKEERILFPLLAAGRGADAEMPIRVMTMEHESAARTLERLRSLTGDYTVPPDACRRWRALWEGLANLESELQMHIRLEDEVLFPRALGETF